MRADDDVGGKSFAFVHVFGHCWKDTATETDHFDTFCSVSAAAPIRREGARRCQVILDAGPEIERNLMRDSRSAKGLNINRSFRSNRFIFHVD